MVNGGCRQVSTVSLLMWQGSGMQVVVKPLVSGISGASWVAEAGFGGVLRALAVGLVVSEMWLVVSGGAEQGAWLSSMNVLTVTW